MKAAEAVPFRLAGSTRGGFAQRGVRGRGLAIGTLLIATLGSGCSRSFHLELPLPKEARWIALLIEDVDGGLVASTGVVPADRAIELAAGARDFSSLRVTVAGVPDEVLRALSAPDAETLAASRVRRAGDPDPLLRGFELLLTGTLTAPLEPASGPIDLTAHWLPPCPTLLEGDTRELIVDTSCHSDRCPASVGQLGCHFQIDGTACNLGHLIGEVDGRGRLALSSGQLDCTREATASEALLSFGCAVGGTDRCGLDLYRPPFPEPFTVLNERALFDVRYSEAGTGFDQQVPLGFTAGLEVLDDRLVIGTYQGRFSDERCAAPGEANQALFLDPSTLATIGTATLPPCLNAIAPDPIGPGFLVLGRSSSTAPTVIERRAPSGEKIAEAVIDPGLGPGFTRNMLRVQRTPPVLAVGYGMSPLTTHDEGQGVLLRLHPETLATDWISPPLGSPVLDLGFEPQQIDLLLEKLGYTMALDLGAGIVRGSVPISVFCGVRALNVINAVFHPASRRFVISTVDSSSEILMLSVRDSFGCRTGAYYQTGAESRSLALADYDPTQVLVGLTATSTDHPAILARLDPERGRFIPGQNIIGRGIVGEIRSRGRDIWLTLPWTARVVHLAPAMR